MEMIIEHKETFILLAFAISEALALIPSVKANGVKTSQNATFSGSLYIVARANIGFNLISTVNLYELL